MNKKNVMGLVFGALMAVSQISFALSLSEAKTDGLVGEMTNGYLGSPSSGASAEVKALMKDINGKRKAKYIEISKKVGKSVSVIEKLAGEKAQAKTKSGQYVQSSSGRWGKK